MSVQFERDERKFDFHDIGLAIKRAREAKGMTQEQLACIIDRDPRTVMYNENDGQHPSLNTFYQMVTMFDISVDQFFYPDKGAASGCKSRIDVMLSSMDEKDLRLGPAKMLVGEPPQTRHLGTFCPKVDCLRHRSYRSCSLFLRWSASPSRWSILALTATASRIRCCAAR